MKKLKRLWRWLVITLRGSFRSTSKINDQFTVPTAMRNKIEIVQEANDFTFQNNLLASLNQFEEPRVENSNLDCDEKDRYKVSSEADYEVREEFQHLYVQVWDEGEVTAQADDYCDIDDLTNQVKPEIQLQTTADFTTQNNDTCTSTPE